MPPKLNLHWDHPPVTIAVRSVRCLGETDEVGADEPYVIVVAADLTSVPPNVEATLYGPFNDTDQGELKETVVRPSWMTEAQAKPLEHLMRRPFWSLDKVAKPIEKKDDVIFLVAVMDNDDGAPDAARLLAKQAVLGSLLGSTSSSRSQRVQKAIADVNSALEVPTGAPNFDDQVDTTKELALTTADLLLPVLGPHLRELSFDGDGGAYTVEFVFTKA